MGWTDILQAVSAVVVAGFTGGLVCVARRQARIMKTQAAIQESTLTATKTAAEAAKKSADVAEQSVNNIERPFVLIQKLEARIKPYMATGSGPAPSVAPYVEVSLKNFGRSPALVSEVRKILDMIPAGQNTPSFPAPALPLNDIVVIGPHDEPWKHKCHYARIVDIGERSQIENGTQQFWFFMSVRYDDMLGHEHQTQMRFRYEPREDRFLSTKGDDYTIRT